MSVFCQPVSAAIEVSTSAQSHVLYCADNQQILACKNENTPMGMASTTKIMTALITLEYAKKQNKIVEFTQQMCAEGSSMYLKAGDKVRLYDLAAGMMTVSGNDAANAAAIAIAGSAEKFAAKMNDYAKRIGMKNTNFANPSGLPDDSHYSSAYDMALLMTYAMKNSDFATLVAQKSITVSFVNPPDMEVTYYNHNKLLSTYKYCVGGKTGYTRAAGRCLVTCSQYDGMRLVAVTLNDRQDWDDHKKLYDYGFENYAPLVSKGDAAKYNLPVIGSDLKSIGVSEGVGEVSVITRKDKQLIRREVFIRPFVFAPVSRGDKVGKVIYTLDGEVIKENYLIAENSAQPVKVSFFRRFMHRLFGNWV